MALFAVFAKMILKSLGQFASASNFSSLIILLAKRFIVKIIRSLIEV